MKAPKIQYYGFTDIYETTGLREAVAKEGFNPFKVIAKLSRDEYTLHLVEFLDDSALGMFIWNDFNNTFYEEPDNLDGYGYTEESLLEEYPSFSWPLEEFHYWKVRDAEKVAKKAAKLLKK